MSSIRATYPGTITTGGSIVVSGIAAEPGDLLVVVLSMLQDEVDQAVISDSYAGVYTERVPDTSDYSGGLILEGYYNMRAWTAPAPGASVADLEVTLTGWTDVTDNDCTVIVDVIQGARGVGGADSAFRFFTDSLPLDVPLTTEEGASLILTYMTSSVEADAAQIPDGYVGHASVGTTGPTLTEQIWTRAASGPATGGDDSLTWNSPTDLLDLQPYKNALAIELLTSEVTVTDGGGSFAPMTGTGTVVVGSPDTATACLSSFRRRGLGNLLDHTANVWRLTETLGDYRETIQTHEEVYTGVLCTFQRRNTVLANQDPGVRPVGERRVYLDPGPVLRDRDIIEIVAGPEVCTDADALLLEVESIAAPRGHHIEIRATEWRGTLPSDS